jgi:hypothetical protein
VIGVNRETHPGNIKQRSALIVPLPHLAVIPLLNPKE